MAKEKITNPMLELVQEWAGYFSEAIIGGMLMPITDRVEAILEDIDGTSDKIENRVLAKAAVVILLLAATVFFAISLFFPYD